MCTAITSSAAKRLSKSLSVRVCAEVWQGAKAVAAMQAAILLASVVIALALQAVAQTFAQQVMVGGVFAPLALFLIIKMLNRIKHSSGFRTKLSKAALLNAQALHLMSKTDAGIKVVNLITLSLSHLVRTLTAHSLDAASESRIASADRARASILMRVCIATTHSSSSLRQPATA